jgi:hypothetical protein
MAEVNEIMTILKVYTNSVIIKCLLKMCFCVGNLVRANPVRPSYTYNSGTSGTAA